MLNGRELSDYENSLGSNWTYIVVFLPGHSFFYDTLGLDYYAASKTELQFFSF